MTTPAGRTCVPTLYVGETYEAAAFETVFRNLPPKPMGRQVFEIDLARRNHARLLVNRDLILGPFFHQNLARIGQTRQSMIDTDATCYGETVLWAAAVHVSFPHLDGLIWTSHQHDRETACVLFGDRAGPSSRSTPVRAAIASANLRRSMRSTSFRHCKLAERSPSEHREPSAEHLRQIAPGRVPCHLAS
ncbi:MAG TPA: RES domain-containing protein [Acetobacteraceae bacterium]|nr:RES domain-containing protein [Acetobacteraceae bacterium]